MVIAGLGLLLLALAGFAGAGSSANYAVEWQVMGVGGAPAESDAGGVTLNGTLGQAAIGHSAGTGVQVGTGYWYGSGVEYRIYLPLILRGG
jgi:hypothetical protein